MSDIVLQFNNHAISAGDMSGNLASSIIDLSTVHGYCVDAVWSGSPVGNVIIAGSNNGTTFKTISTTAAGGGAGQLLSNNDGIHYNYLKITYTFTSGTGTLDVYVSGKRY